jgi:hypothetical protein
MHAMCTQREENEENYHLGIEFILMTVMRIKASFRRSEEGDEMKSIWQNARHPGESRGPVLFPRNLLCE